MKRKHESGEAVGNKRFKKGFSKGKNTHSGPNNKGKKTFKTKSKGGPKGKPKAANNKKDKKIVSNDKKKPELKSKSFEKSTANNKGNGSFNKFKNNNFSKKGQANLDKAKFQKTQNSTATESGKPDWIEYKKQQKELKEKRRSKKLEDSYDVSLEAKKIGEQLRNKNLAPDVQEKLTKKLYELMKNQYEKLIYSHDIARVVQWQLKYCSSDIQVAIVEELKSNLCQLIFSKYSKNIIKTLLKVGNSATKKIILQTCFSHVVKLLSSVISSSIFEKIYVEVASDSEKNLLKQELYVDLYKKSKDPNVKTLPDVYKESVEMKTATLSAVKANLTKILNKNLINSTLVHTVLYEYLCNCTKDDRIEMLALARPLIAELSQTKDGTKAANMCIWHGTNKDRKHIMKSIKEHVKNIATSEHGYLMILALVDAVDDTVLLKKIVIQELLNNLTEIALNEYGRNVILYLIARRDTHYFHPQLVNYFKLGDGNEASKKPADIREKELVECVLDSLLSLVAADAKTWLANGSIQIVTSAILKASSGDRPKLAFEAIAKFITNPESKLEKDSKPVAVIEEAGLHMILKKIIQLDKKRLEKAELTFGEVIIEYLTAEVIEHWINYNRACFLLILLLENESEKVVSEIKSRLKKVKNLSSKNSKGATILLKKLN